MESVEHPVLSISTTDEYLILDSEEESFPVELSAVEALVAHTFSHMSAIEAMEDWHLDSATLAYCHFSRTLAAKLTSLKATYSILQKRTEFERWRDNWNSLKAIVLKLQTKLLSLIGALPLFIDEKVVTASVDGESFRATKEELEVMHKESLELVTAIADELTSNEIC